MSKISISKKRIRSIIKEEVAKYLLQEDKQRDEIRDMLDQAIMQMESHGELIQDAILVLSSQEVNQQQLEEALKAQARYVDVLLRLKESLR